VLSLAEREEISRGVAVGHSVREIAGRLGRAPSTVCRELGRHGGRTRYRAATADAAAWELARRPKVCKLAAVPRLRTLVAEKLQQDWSPEQTAGCNRICDQGRNRNSGGGSRPAADQESAGANSAPARLPNSSFSAPDGRLPRSAYLDAGGAVQGSSLLPVCCLDRTSPL